jgi:6-phosphofructokinase 1
MAGLAGGAEVISTPEAEVPAREIAERLRAAFERGKTHAIVVIAEGVKENAAKILSYFDADKQRTGFELRATTLGHVVRGAPPSAFDRLLATRLGVNAVKCLSNGETGGFCQHLRQVADTSRRGVRCCSFWGMKRNAVPGVSINGHHASV